MRGEEVSGFAIPNDAYHIDPSVPLESILCTQELRRRPTRPPDYEKETRALAALARALVDSKTNVLQILAEKILDVTQCDSSGLSLLTKDDGGKNFYWPSVAGSWKPLTGAGPRVITVRAGMCWIAIARLCSTASNGAIPVFDPSCRRLKECLIVQFYVDGTAVGTMWAVMHSDRRKFDAEDVRVMTALGQFAAVAYQTLESLHDLKMQVAARKEAEKALTEGLVRSNSRLAASWYSRAKPKKSIACRSATGFVFGILRLIP